MSRPAARARRSGDPRVRAGASGAPGPDRRVRVSLLALVVAVGVVALAVLALPDTADDGPDPAPSSEVPGAREALAACDLTTKADEASEADTRARYAAAVLLLDQAIIASRRAAVADATYVDLDVAVRAVHRAGHAGDPAKWESALVAALEACRTRG